MRFLEIKICDGRYVGFYLKMIKSCAIYARSQKMSRVCFKECVTAQRYLY